MGKSRPNQVSDEPRFEALYRMHEEVLRLRRKLKKNSCGGSVLYLNAGRFGWAVSNDDRFELCALACCLRCLLILLGLVGLMTRSLLKGGSGRTGTAALSHVFSTPAANFFSLTGSFRC